MAAMAAMAPAPVRLTRRGRAVVLAFLLLLAAGVIALAAGPTLAADPPGSLPTVVVDSDDTLWKIAGRVDTRHDRFVVINEIRRLNGIADYTVHPGQRLILPRPR
jgi:LysM repeat protein